MSRRRQFREERRPVLRTVRTDGGWVWTVVYRDTVVAWGKEEGEGGESRAGKAVRKAAQTFWKDLQKRQAVCEAAVSKAEAKDKRERKVRAKSAPVVEVEPAVKYDEPDDCDKAADDLPLIAIPAETAKTGKETTADDVMKWTAEDWIREFPEYADEFRADLEREKAQEDKEAGARTMAELESEEEAYREWLRDRAGIA